MKKLAIAALASGALALSLTACGPADGSDEGAGLRKNTPTSATPTSTERRLPRIQLPDIKWPKENGGTDAR
ncbi:hypothetical protein [Nocardia mexicana]|uniref:Uncharacterized protein n=1 Tax=Nocardia mexicana TaxID=279262 RepID=A0A370GFF7_9NOCA|nr:hypothetical protein [Nocardia mexicana]RDI42391.1 hypothetical protein DFR68_12747 [Nocardia mexicana]